MIRSYTGARAVTVGSCWDGVRQMVDAQAQILIVAHQAGLGLHYLLECCASCAKYLR